MIKKHTYYLVISDLIIFLIMAYFILTWGVMGGYDPIFHMGRIHTLATNIASGHFPNPIGFEYIKGLGYGVGFFYGNFFLYPFALLNTIGISRYTCYVLFILCSLIAAIVAINCAVHKLFHQDWATIISAPLYLSSYYYINVIFLRAAAGEMLAFAIVPWAFLDLFKVVNGEQHYWYLIAVTFALLLVAHVLSFLILVGTASLLAVINIPQFRKQPQILGNLCKSALLFGGLTMVFLLPFIEQYTAQKYISTTMNPGENIYSIVSDVLYLHQIFDLRQIIALNGILILILFILAIVFNAYQIKVYHSSNRIINQASFIVLLLSIFLISPLALRVLVKIFRPIVLLQVITRINIVILPLCIFIISVAVGQMINSLSNYQILLVAALIFVLAVITVTSPIKQNIAAMQPRRAQVPDAYNISRGEYEPQDFFNYDMSHQFKVNIAFLERHEGYQVLTNNHHQATIKLKPKSSKTVIMLPRLYYRGYQVWQGTHRLPVTKRNGLVAVKLSSHFSKQPLTISYHQTLLAKIGWVISIISLGILITGHLFKHKFIR
ncbi:hypothetical protein DS831_01380 [Bombilactobacillus bombi]|uniref:Membrane protein 6-pyruvoyl-tetrahydropterin synthase-related domain-containing protein n=1 Tax=Bombilactobacillus bombi TaxID=1303590 RepID=A0A3R6VB86_9LACO|nr:hypothetical protein [Bombilactobacillus bombi]RHW52010.1 hypothetical protein DS831_01380 [Bombilactobacillus bombi]